MKEIITKKIKLFTLPEDDKEEQNRIYNYLRESMEAQSDFSNDYISHLYVESKMEDSKDNRKELHKLYSRIPNSKKGSAYDPSIKTPTCFVMGNVTKAIEADFKTSLKKGLMHGVVSLPTYKKTNPLFVHVNYCNLRSIVKEKTGKNTGIYHNYDGHEEFLEHLYKKDIDIRLQFANHILFKLFFGNNVKKSYEMRTVFQKIFEGEYTIHGSKISLEKRKDGSGDDIFLLLSIEIPPVETYLDENIVVGVDTGIKIPAYCALNTNPYIKLAVGDGDRMIEKRTAIKAEKDRLKKNLAFAKGGHGRKRKLVKLAKFSEHEQAVMKHIDHCISKKVVEFAVKHHAKYINIEDLSGISKKNKKLKDWSFFRLQEYIIYKAEKYGIVVRKVDPKNTSKTCSCCGNLEDGQRIDQAHFVCKKCGEEMNADYNAARNIAMSIKFVTEEKKKKNKAEENKESKENVA